MPAGLSVLLVSSRALKKAQAVEAKISVGTFHRFSEMAKFVTKNQTPETPNVLNIYLLGKVVASMLKTGIDTIRRDTLEKSRRIYSFFENRKGFVLPNLGSKYRSVTTIMVNVLGGSAPLIKELKKKGFTVSSGYKENKEKQIRIANFPAVSKKTIQRVIREIREMGDSGEEYKK